MIIENFSTELSERSCSICLLMFSCVKGCWRWLL